MARGNELPLCKWGKIIRLSVISVHLLCNSPVMRESNIKLFTWKGADVELSFYKVRQMEMSEPWAYDYYYIILHLLKCVRQWSSGQLPSPSPEQTFARRAHPFITKVNTNVGLSPTCRIIIFIYFLINLLTTWRLLYVFI